jgi:hypothetical protein
MKIIFKILAIWARFKRYYNEFMYLYLDSDAKNIKNLLNWTVVDQENLVFKRYWGKIPYYVEKYQLGDKLKWWQYLGKEPLHDATCTSLSYKVGVENETGTDVLSIAYTLDRNYNNALVVFNYYEIIAYKYYASSRCRYFKNAPLILYSPVEQSILDHIMIPSEEGFTHQVLLLDGALLIKCKNFDIIGDIDGIQNAHRSKIE